MVAKVVLKGHILVPPDEMAAVSEALVTHVKLTREEPGCLHFEVKPDEAIPGRFNVYEVFANPAAFEAHQERVRLSSWSEVTRNVTRHYEVEGLKPSP